MPSPLLLAYLGLCDNCYSSWLPGSQELFIISAFIPSFYLKQPFSLNESHTIFITYKCDPLMALTVFNCSIPMQTIAMLSSGLSSSVPTATSTPPVPIEYQTQQKVKPALTTLCILDSSFSLLLSVCLTKCNPSRVSLATLQLPT